MNTTVTAPAIKNKTKIMIVEDESIIALDIKNSLSKLGYAITGVAASGDAALMKIKENRPNLVLMDIHLKGEMNGIQTSEIIKSDFHLPVIYLTANADSSTFQSAQATDPHAYLLKPFNEKSLSIAIEVALNQHRKAQAIQSSEHWYANAFQCLNESVMATDSEGSIVFMNALAEEMTGVALSDAIDQPIANILRLQRKIQQVDRLSLRTKDSVKSILSTVLDSGAVVPLPADTQLITPSLSFISIEGSATSIRDASGRVTGSLFLFRSADYVATTVPPVFREGEAESSLGINNYVGKNQESSVPADDVELIKVFTQAFVNNEPVSLSTKSLVASSGEGQLTLSSRKQGIIVSVQEIKGKRTAIVAQNAFCWDVIRHMLVENSFFPVSQRTNGTCHFQYRAVPEDCQLFHTSAMELWETWYGKACPDLFNEGAIQVKLSRESILVLRRGSWYRIQNLVLREENLHVKTMAGELVVPTDDLLIWGARV